MEEEDMKSSSIFSQDTGTKPMTDRIKGLVVGLDQDYREDDVQAIVDAIKMVKGVASVEQSVATVDDYLNRERVRQELVGKVFEALKVG